MPADQNSTQKLPVIDTIKKSIQLLVRNPKNFLHASLPLVLFGIVNMVFAFLANDPLAPAGGTKFLLVTIVFITLSIWVYSASFISLYRLILLGELPSGLGIHFGRRERLFIGYVLGLGLLWLISVVVFSILGIIPLLGAIVVLIYPFALLFIIFRLSFLWPAIALDQKTNWRKSFQQTKGNVLRLMMGPFLLSLPFILLSLLMGFAVFVDIFPQLTSAGHDETAIRAIMVESGVMANLQLVSLLLFPVQIVLFILCLLFNALAYYILVPEARMSAPETDVKNTDVFI